MKIFLCWPFYSSLFYVYIWSILCKHGLFVHNKHYTVYIQPIQHLLKEGPSINLHYNIILRYVFVFNNWDKIQTER